MKINNDEWFEISNALEPHHAVFTKVWQMGKPMFDENIPTAAVQFDKEGNFILFKFNPEFWKSLDLKNRLFVICHESLHIILNHGIRAKDGDINYKACNVAMDIVVNHSLVRNFGFKRDEIDNSESYCWVDTVFKNNDPIPKSNEMFEFYYNLFEKTYGDGFPLDENDGKDGKDGGQGSGSCKTVDDHDSMFSSSGGEPQWQDAIDKLNESLSDEEKDSLKQIIQKHFQKSESPNSPAGVGTGGQWVFAKGPKATKKKKWETVIKKWVMNVIRHEDTEAEQWSRKNRRLHMIPSDLMIPSDYEVEDRSYDKRKIEVWFYLDTSGSCWHLKDRFFSAAESLPEDRFKVRLFCFDTQVEETNLETKRIYGGGGTSFAIIEKHISFITKKESIEYPHAVWIITDGYGDRVTPNHPERWKWFLTSGSTKDYVPDKSEVFSLENFE